MGATTRGVFQRRLNAARSARGHASVHRNGLGARRTAAALAVGMTAALALTGSVVSAPAAGAAMTYQVTNYDNDGTSGVYLRNSSNINDVVRDAAHYLTYGTSVNLICAEWGSAVGPYSNTAWDYVQVVNGPNAGKFGHLSEHWLNTPVATNQHVAGETSCGAPVASPPPVSGTYVDHGTAVRFCPWLTNAGCQPAGGPTVATNQSVSMICWRKGSWYVGDYGTDMFFWVHTSSGANGYVSASYVKRQTSVGWCGDNKRLTAAETAVARYGQVWASTADKSLFSASEWSPGPVGEWSGDCVKLGYVAWHAAGVWVPKSNAINNYAYYHNRGLIHLGVPPTGALVFYNLTSLGHEAVALADGWVAATRGLDNQYLSNTVYPYTSKPNYLGWAMPA